jgi:hypothetical protein
MSIQIQITILSDKGYRPLSTLIEVDNVQEYINNKVKYQQDAILKICANRHMTIRDLRKYGYTQIKAREYNKEKIAQENAERYERIKKERGWT